MADYCSIERVKLRLDITSTSYDVLLNELIGSASRWVDRYCRLPEDGFAQGSTASRYYSEEDVSGQTLHLDMPLLTLSSITNGNGVAVTSGQYRLLPRNDAPYWRVLLLTGYAWQWSTDGEIEVAGVWGYSTAVPSPVQEATAMLAGWTFKRYQAALQDATVNVELGEISYSEAIPKQVRALLQPYVNLGRAV